MENLQEVRWGILGCGDVCEVKSGPAFNKVANSELVAVMRRDREKVIDFARRHRVPKFYTDVNDLINDPDINAIYIATPPVYHEAYAIACMQAGKPVYIEKPIALNSPSCARILKAASDLHVKASVAHYRRGLPLFKKIKSLLDSGAIGKPRLIQCTTFQAATNKMKGPDYWRTTPEISGGGLFFDLAPHQLDIFYWFFGSPAMTRGFSLNQTSDYSAPDLTNVEALFGDVYLHGIWSFNLDPSSNRDVCEIFGDSGQLRFSFFRPSEIEVITSAGSEKISEPFPENIQQPMIGEVVRFFRGEGENPCSLADALVTMQVMDSTQVGQPTIGSLE